VITGLEQSHAEGSPLCGALQRLVYQDPACPAVLLSGVNRHRADRADDRPLVQKVAPDHPSRSLGQQREKAGMGGEARYRRRRLRDSREIMWEAVAVGNRGERLITDPTAFGHVVRVHSADPDLVHSTIGHSG